MIGSLKMVLYRIYLLPLCFGGHGEGLGVEVRILFFSAIIQKGKKLCTAQDENIIRSSAFSGGRAYHSKGVNIALEG